MSPLVISALLFIVGAKDPPYGPPDKSPPEVGHGLTAKQAADGWLSLYDGKTTYGWTGATVQKDGTITGGIKTSLFEEGEYRGEVVGRGSFKTSAGPIRFGPGLFNIGLKTKPGAIELTDGLSLRKLTFVPVGLARKFNGKNLDGWKVLPHPTRKPDQQAKWTVANGVVRAVGGPGAIELQEKYADFVLQVQVRTKRMANGGVFVRADPGSFMNGYEAQVFNACYGGDPGKPAEYSTGAIDDRQLARRLVSRDGEWFTMTVIAVGPHIATWVNGYQTTDWTDTRAKDLNPRKGLRTEAGTIQLQAHDPETDMEFRGLKVAELAGKK